MKILLSKRIPQSAIMVATTEDDLRTLRILFNHSLIRYAYVFWAKKDGYKLDEKFSFLEKYNPLAYVSIHAGDPIEDTTREEKISQFKKEMEGDTPADELSSFLEGDTNG